MPVTSLAAFKSEVAFSSPKQEPRVITTRLAVYHFNFSSKVKVIPVAAGHLLTKLPTGVVEEHQISVRRMNSNLIQFND